MKNYLPRALAVCILAPVVIGCGSVATNSEPSNVSTTVTSLQVMCSPSAVSTSATSQCSASVQGTGSYSSAVTWSASAGTIGANGLLTAPSSAGTVTVTATSTEDAAKTAATAVTVQAAPQTPVQSPAPSVSSVAVTCSPSAIAPGTTAQCNAAVQGTGSYSSAVKWSASGGSISSAGVLSAPRTAGTVTVTAVSTQNSGALGKATVTVESNPPTIAAVSVTCNPATVDPGGTSQCSANVRGTGSYNSAVAWSASGGSISQGGLFTASSAAGTVTVTAKSVGDAAVSASSKVTVQAQTAAQSPQSGHVVWVMEENSGYSTVVGSGAWPNLNDLIRDGALPTNYYANTHPSIGNYLMLTTGQVLTNNDNSTEVWNVDNIARRMLSSGVPFRIYAEGIGRGYVGGNTGLYLIRHNPFALLSDLAHNSQEAYDHIFPFSQFAADLANGDLPEFSYIVPDVDDDAHNGTPQQADSWLLSHVVNPLSNDSSFQPGGDGVLIVDFDEAADSDTTHGGGHVSPVFWGPIVKSGYRQTSSTVYQHESMLREMMQLLNLPDPPGAAGSAPLMTEFFK